MTPPFTDICTKDLCRDGIYYAKGSYFRKIFGFMQGGGGGGGGAGPNPTFSSSGHFSSIHILNIDLSLGYPPPPTFMGAGNKWK